VAYEQRDNSGSLFKNDRKGKDSHPDYKGTAMIGGQVYWISGWIKDGQKGKFFSFAFKAKDEQGAPVARGVSASGHSSRDAGSLPHSDMDDDIPFAPEWR
jgi:hypothetical protein